MEGPPPSILDRLIQSESGDGDAEAALSDVDAVRRDLEELLNTRQSVARVPSEFPEVGKSLITYGIPDFGSIDASSQLKCEELGRKLRDLIALHEPRLKDVRITLMEPASKKLMALRFSIEARLAQDDNPNVSYETVFELSSGKTSVRKGGR